MAFNGPGEGIYCAGSVSVDCCDVYGNTGGDWVGGLAGLEELNGNFSSDPLFCDAPNRDYRIDEASECNQPPCGLVGAWPVGCPVSGVADGAPAGNLRFVPNPTRGPCRVVLGPAGRPWTSVVIFDAAGRTVRMLGDDAQASAGRAIDWDGRDGEGVLVPAGVYVARVASPGGVRAGRLIVVR